MNKNVIHKTMIFGDYFKPHHESSTLPWSLIKQFTENVPKFVELKYNTSSNYPFMFQVLFF